jgi:hypothetical protein
MENIKKGLCFEIDVGVFAFAFENKIKKNNNKHILLLFILR